MDYPKRISFLCHPYHRGGVTRWMADAAIFLSNKGVEVFFITLEPKKDFFSGQGRETLIQLIEKAGTSIKIIKTKVGRSFEFGTPYYCAIIYKQVTESGLPLGTPIILSDDLYVWMAATYLHASYPIIGVLHADEEYYYKLAQNYYQSTDAFVCVSNRILKNLLEKSNLISANNVKVIPCGIHLPEIVYKEKDDNTLQLIYVGRLTEYQKRVSDIFKICERLYADNLQFHITIIGEGEAKNKLIEQFRVANMEKLATFTGWLSQNEVSDYLAVSDILVLTSDFEGMPVAMMEALSAGCGVVGTRVSGMEDYENVPEAENCLQVYIVGNINDAVYNIKKLASIPYVIRKNAARTIAEKDFSMEICVNKYMEVCNSIPTRIFQKTNIAISTKAIVLSKFRAAIRYLKVRFR